MFLFWLKMSTQCTFNHVFVSLGGIQQPSWWVCVLPIAHWILISEVECSWMVCVRACVRIHVHVCGPMLNPVLASCVASLRCLWSDSLSTWTRGDKITTIGLLQQEPDSPPPATPSHEHTQTDAITRYVLVQLYTLEYPGCGITLWMIGVGVF